MNCCCVLDESLKEWTGEEEDELEVELDEDEVFEPVVEELLDGNGFDMQQAFRN